jgi:cobalamin biosynthesis protein CobC
MLEHGGRLRQAARGSVIPLADWLDLSTGINPQAWPVPPLPPAVWQRLPEDDDGLAAAAAAYYGNDRLLAVAGSQAAIQMLPQLFPLAAVACLAPLYGEHPVAWQGAGHRLRRLPAGNLARALAAATPRVLLCNPNNPTAHALSRAEVLAAADTLAQRGGWLVVDEAFVDATPELSVADLAGSETAPNLVVLRSLGKFFGLAGARVGFVFGDRDLLAALGEKLGPWSVSHPARWVATQALADRAWQAAARRQLADASRRLVDLLAPLALVDAPPAACALFVTLRLPQVKPLANFLKARGILVRIYPEESLLRCGLPGDEIAWQRLAAALAEWSLRRS